MYSVPDFPNFSLLHLLSWHKHLLTHTATYPVTTYAPPELIDYSPTKLYNKNHCLKKEVHRMSVKK